MGTSFAIGQELGAPGTQLHLSTDTLNETRTTYNVLAETPRGNPDNVVMTGAHLDSVEELNLLGSEHYVGDLAENNPDALGDIALYLNFDMVGSPSFVRFVYDGDNSTGEGAEGPEGSPEIESIFSGYFERQGLASEGSGHHATGKTKLAARGQVHMHGHESAR